MPAEPGCNPIRDKVSWRRRRGEFEKSVSFGLGAVINEGVQGPQKAAVTVTYQVCNSSTCTQAKNGNGPARLFTPDDGRRAKITAMLWNGAGCRIISVLNVSAGGACRPPIKMRAACGTREDARGYCSSWSTASAVDCSLCLRRACFP